MIFNDHPQSYPCSKCVMCCITVYYLCGQSSAMLQQILFFDYHALTMRTRQTVYRMFCLFFAEKENRFCTLFPYKPEVSRLWRTRQTYM